MKNILIIRTSTDRQEVESQKQELIDYVKSRNEEEIVVIGGEGASAIKLDEKYLANIQQVYDTMKRGDIVWAWSIDRIGRNEEVLMAFKNKLIKAGVNLIIKNPALQLLDADGSVNSGIELAFSLFATMSKQEMEQKQDRFKRAKKRNKQNGKYNGGHVLFGCSVDDEGYFAIDDHNARIVRELFTRYANEPVSCRYLSHDYHGILKTKNVKYTEIRINQILRNRLYLGNETYPQIIDTELFERVQEKLKNFRIQPKQKYGDYVYWCQGLIFEDCTDIDGTFHRMRIKKSEAAYVSYLERMSLSINYFDSLIYILLSDLFENYNDKEFSWEIKKKNILIMQRWEHIQELIKEQIAKDAELDEKYFIHGNISKNNYPVLKEKIRKKIEELKAESAACRLYDTAPEKPSMKGLDEKQIKDMFIKYIRKINVKKIDNYTCQVDLKTTIGDSPSVVYSRKGYTYRYINSNTLYNIPKMRNIVGRPWSARKQQVKEYKARKKAEKDSKRYNIIVEVVEGKERYFHGTRAGFSTEPLGYEHGFDADTASAYLIRLREKFISARAEEIQPPQE